MIFKKKKKRSNIVALKVRLENSSNTCLNANRCPWQSGGNAMTDVIVNDLVLLWQLLITPPVTDSPFAIATTALVVCDNHCQEVILWQGRGCPSLRSHQPQIDTEQTRATRQSPLFIRLQHYNRSGWAFTATGPTQDFLLPSLPEVAIDTLCSRTCSRRGKKV